MVGPKQAFVIFPNWFEMHLQSYGSGNFLSFSVSQSAVLNCAIQKPAVQGSPTLQLIIYRCTVYLDFFAFCECRKRERG